MLLIEFGKGVVKSLGENIVTPNMHLACHIKETLLAFGPFHGYWLFSFERYNGILGSFSTNNHRIEIQIMRKFIQQNYLHAIAESSKDEFYPTFHNLVAFRVIQNAKLSIGAFMMQNKDINEIHVDNWSSLENISLPKSYTIRQFDNDEMLLLQKMYDTIYDGQLVTLHSDVMKCFDSIKICNDNYHSKRSVKSDVKTMSQALFQSDTMRPLEISYFCTHCVLVNNKDKRHVLAAVNWYQSSLEKTDFVTMSSWFKPRIYNVDCVGYIPVQKLNGKCTFVVDDSSRKIFVT